ncbi:hypothetical protein SFMTTN_3175 [Sulfuriferula multivorans]|uniref:Uncharacterized protein n=1 Tax=Sulfuriferula multivorans TaxID=1559896 RepID=A0A401JH66_9PROT|nr:hypothetical protein SFMTTN_3175 [Sulfuriferula multivorans]
MREACIAPGKFALWLPDYRADLVAASRLVPIMRSVNAIPGQRIIYSHCAGCGVMR